MDDDVSRDTDDADDNDTPSEPAPEVPAQIRDLTTNLLAEHAIRCRPRWWMLCVVS